MARAARDLEVLTHGVVQLIEVIFPPDDEYEAPVAKLWVLGEEETLWDDCTTAREDVFWLEKFDFSGTIVEIARFLT